jgi:hypothetical protein
MEEKMHWSTGIVSIVDREDEVQVSWFSVKRKEDVPR